MQEHYLINARIRILRDSPKNIDFHIRTGDYFLYVATLVGALEEALGRGEYATHTEQERAIARELRNDLRYVHANYEIHSRSLADIQMIRPAGNLLSR